MHIKDLAERAGAGRCAPVRAGADVLERVLARRPSPCRNGRRGGRVTACMALSGTYVPSKQQWVRDQVAEFEASDGARANTLRNTGDPIVVITSVGAKSGNLRKNPVMRVERDGTYVAIASKGGSDDNPEWYHNFLAHPEVELQDGAEKHTYTVRLAQGRGAGRLVGLLGRDLADVRRLREADRPRDPGLPARARLTQSPGRRSFIM